MNRNSCGMLIGGAVIAGISLLFFPAAAESPKDMGGKWGGKCATSGRAAACCKEQRSADTACKNLEKEKAGSSAVKNCEEAEKVCEAAVRSAEEAKKAEDEKKKKAEDAKKTEENKAAAVRPRCHRQGRWRITGKRSSRRRKMTIVTPSMTPRAGRTKPISRKRSKEPTISRRGSTC